MRIVVLGSGTSVPHAQRRPPAFLVQADEASLLLDAGAGCSSSLAAAGVSLAELSGIALTHLHPDHTAELVPILFALHNPLGPRRGADLPIWGPEGTENHLAALADVHGGWLEPQDHKAVTVDLPAGQIVEIGPLRMRPFAVRHQGACFAYSIEGPGGRFCFSGDTGLCPGLIAAAQGADVLVCECAAMEGERADGHLTATQVGEVAAVAGCKAVVLTHLYEHVVESDPVARVKRRFDGPVSMAEDGMMLPLYLEADEADVGPDAATVTVDGRADGDDPGSTISLK